MRIDIDIVQGQDGDGVILPLADAGGTPIAEDPTGWECYSTIKSRGYPVMTRDSRVDPATATVITHEGALAVRLLWSRQDTVEWRFEKGKWDIWVVNPEGEHYKVGEGDVFVDLRVSDAN